VSNDLCRQFVSDWKLQYFSSYHHAASDVFSLPIIFLAASQYRPNLISTHADLHPGNILVNSNKQFVLLDAGIVVEHSKRDHRLISDVLAAFIRRAGRRAGERMMEDSNYRMASSGERSVDEEEFLDRIESLTERAHGKDYFMQHLGTYITFICDSAARHHVMLNQAFISAALAVKVQEGIALALDPTVEVWRLAIPVILEGERKHGYAIDHAKEVMGMERVTNWMKGVFLVGDNSSRRS
jgi:predicted unusual protein kinase regulating ubiquinone biosynthesis (AarF/ABC1/UbiB family)